ncbi:sigma-70 family RNA polymerase sigma factor [Phytoactinopolyspora alkaliphila]|uniref:Sigma-70 family RNA polymerase sigma factor n=1 Tax=Phytoactinopolyspora alkaliphila TaxID=1783498 RepID=A0A6N9YLS7_9ACTN|nr:sigma-70 family RNA polymerase sigma factor [Phytoactinopolyspora alkaliphila]
MNEDDVLAERFEEHRVHLRAVAYRMLGSLSEADDAVQEAWIRLNGSASEDIENLGGWLTTVTGRVCLNMLRARKARPEQPVGAHIPDPIISHPDGPDPEHEAMLADSVGLALLVVLDTLAPPERLAFVLHDMFAVPFSEISSIVGSSPTAARQLASRARRRVRQAAPAPDLDLALQREVVDAFLTASREGDFAALISLLDPDVVLRFDGGQARPALSVVVRGAKAVSEQARIGARLGVSVKPVLVNAAAGVIVAPRGAPVAIMGFTVRGGRIVAIDVLADPVRIGQLGVSAFVS